MQKVFLSLVFFITIMSASSNDFVMELIQNDLEKALNLYKIGDAKHAKEEVKFALYHGYRNSGLKSQIEKERSFDEANAIEEKFLNLEQLIEKPHQLNLIGAEMETLQESIRHILPTLSPLTKRASVKNWHLVTQKINEALLEAIALYQQKAFKQAISKVQSVYFDIFENSGMEGAILALSEDRKLKAEQRFRVLSEMMKKGESAATLVNYLEEIEADLSELSSLLTPKELSSGHTITQERRIPLLQWLMSALFLLIPMGGWLLLKKQRNRD